MIVRPGMRDRKGGQQPGRGVKSIFANLDVAGRIGAIDHEAVGVRPIGQQRHAEESALAVGRQVIDREEQCLRRSEEHTSELQSLMRISYAVFCLKKKKKYRPKR